MLRAHFQKDVDEGAGLEVVTLEPVSEHVENCQQPFLGRVSAAPGFRNDEVDRPDLVAERQEGKNQRILGRKVAVERRLGHA
jgi:hypothetical protein